MQLGTTDAHYPLVQTETIATCHDPDTHTSLYQHNEDNLNLRYVKLF